MIAYNTQWLEALAVKEQSRKWHNTGLLSGTQLQAIQEKFGSQFYTPNTFVRIGLGIFCCILVISIFGLFGMAIVESFDNETATGIICLFFSLALVAALEYFIKKKNFYRAGIDDALLYMALSLAIVGLSLIFSPVFKEQEVLYCVLALPFLLVAAIRYIDTVVTLFTFICLNAILFLLFKENTSLARLLPISCMLLSAIIYYAIRKNKNRMELHFWADCMMVLKACSLILFYFSGNYLVVEDLGNMLFPGFKIPFSFVFWLFTALTPIAYVYFGLKNFDRLLLRIGLIMIAVSVITFKYYFGLGHHEITLTISGTILIIVAYLSIKYLKTKPRQFTYAEDRTDENPGFENAEAIIIAQTTGVTTPENEFSFGGGKYGGGGAGGSY